MRPPYDLQFALKGAVGTVWAKAVHGTNGVTIDDSTDLGGGFHQVNVAIPRALAPGGKLFARLKVTVTTVP